MTNQNLADTIEKGVSAHRDGRPADALGFYKQALAAKPDDPQTQTLYGLALVHLGRTGEAEPYIRAAVEAAPDDTGYRTNLADYYRAAGDDDAAYKEIERIIATDPSLPYVWERKGDIHFQRSEHEPAARAYNESLQLFGDNYALTIKLARSLCGIQQLDDALKSLDHADQINPGAQQTSDMRCEVLIAKADWPGLQALADQRAAADSTDAMAWRYLATAYFELGRHRAAGEAFEKAMAHGERSALTLSQYAKLCIQALDFDRAEKALDEAEAFDPNLAEVLSAKALLLTYQGRTDEAEKYCVRCLEANPNFMDVYPQLSALRKGALSEAEEAPLMEFSRREDVSLAGRATASFVLAHSYDARSEFEKAFGEYEYANRLAAQRNAHENSQYNREGMHGWTSRLIDRFTGQAATLAAQNAKLPATPIFIVGLPHCGSTLVESVLSAHSKVAAGGEQSALPAIFVAWIKAQGSEGDGVLSEADRKQFVEKFFEHVTLVNGALANVAPYLTDENLLNIESVGLIAQLFPDAKIINIRRNPLECGLSIFRNGLPKFWNYANDLTDIGMRYGEYARLAAHFEGAYPDRFLTIQYENFTSNFDEGARAMVAFCGLEWEDACSTFQSTGRIAATISAVQAREEVETKSGRAEAYGSHLGPLRDALTAASVDLETGAWTG